MANATHESMGYLSTAIEEINRSAQSANGMADETHRYAKEGAGSHQHC